VRGGALLVCALLIAAGVPARPARAEGPSREREDRVKAAFLYKFSGYVEWPEGVLAPDAPLRIGVIGSESLAKELTRMTAVRAGRPVEVLTVRPFDPVPDVHVLFIGRSQSDRLSALIRTVPDRPILVVTDCDGALAQGSMINFVVVSGHLRFEVALQPVRRRHLSLSSRLLAVAQSVVTQGEP
jgi:hypothetical protein